MQFQKWILGSRSPRRRELLMQLVPESAIQVIPPLDPDEAGFEDLHDLTGIQERLAEICRDKNEDVFEQVQSDDFENTLLLTSDTIIVVERQAGYFVVLGQPVANTGWEQEVRDWFLEDYAGKTHRVITGLCLRSSAKTVMEFSQTLVSFHEREFVREHLDWYLSTGESLGKAGGYAVQGAGSIFVKRIEGSLTNVVGLPLEKLLPFVS
ncbi:Maf-like protein YhdE [Gimesia panareensis]|uniref:dTTP/UTP pyrophosphatase n=1 Tax=Gimesia panareensis TaxID=2527978 RepID=A0A517QBH7_9PLAN|nr:Maf family protein [Gimesia panareensis]QDT28993.1 Maf-like protein YhdE [Gimesia panareensis]QDV19785.1 Maf-like protein YhdE [Gimesia panareensis]